MTYSDSTKMAIAIATAMLLVVGLVYFMGVRNTFAVAPSDYGLKEGNTISAAGSNDPDVYIVNDWGYKRLFLNPVIFGFYGQLTGGFAGVKNVSPATRDAFITSGLFRNCETNDQKVYGVETTGEDTGTFHWVNTSGAQAVSDDPNFFKKVFCINTNEFNWYPKGSDYTSVNQVPNYTRTPGATPTPSVVSGPVNVMLASDNPGAATLTKNATGFTLMKIALSGNGTIQTLRVVRGGAGLTADFSNVYLYNGAQRLTSGRTLSSADGSTTFSNLNFTVNGSAVLSVVADMAGTAGDVDNLSIGSSDITLVGGGTAGGSFPLQSSNFTISGSSGGGITVDSSGSLANPNAGQTNVEVAEFKLTANTEGAYVKRLQFIQGGTIANSGLTNLKLNVSGQTIGTGSMTSNGYAVFDLSSNPYFIAKGDVRIFQVYADVTGKKADTITLYFETSSDVLATGNQYGFGMAPTFNNMSSAATAQALTLQGGVLTLSFVGPPATNVPTVATHVHLLDYNMNAAANLDIRKTAIILCDDMAGAGTYGGVLGSGTATGASLSAGFTDLNNVEIINRDTGTVLVGPADGTSFTSAGATANGGTTTSCGSTGGNDPGYAKLFTDSFSMTAGQTLHLAIVADVKTSNTGNSLTSGSNFKALLGGYGTMVTTAGDLTILKYSDSSTGPYSTDVVPSTLISGNSLTVQGSSLTLALAANPPQSARNFVKGTSNVNDVGFSFSAAQGSNVTITAITLQGYAGSSTTVATTGNPGYMISAIRLVDGDTGAVISATPSANNLSDTSTTSSGKVVFNNLSWTIPSGATKTLLAQVDLGTNAQPTNNYLSFDVAAVGSVTAVDQNSNSVTLANAAVNGTTTAKTYIIYNNTGTITATAAADAAATGAVYWGQTAAPFTKLKFTSTSEGYTINTLNIYDRAATPTSPVNVNRVNLSYTDKSGNTQTMSQSLNSAASTSFGFSGTTAPYVPKDGTMYITVSADMTTAAGNSTRADGVNFVLSLSSVHSDEFKAVGDSGTTITGGSSGQGTTALTISGTGTYVDGQTQYVYRSFPQLAYISTPATTLNVGQDVLRFSITAMGLASDGATVFFDGATGRSSGSLTFAVLASGELLALNGVNTSNSMGFDLRREIDSSGASVDQLVATRSLVYGATCSGGTVNCARDFSVPGKAASASFRFQDTSGNQSIEIPAGSSNTFVLRLNQVTGFAKGPNTTSGRSGDYLQFVLRGVADDSTATKNQTTAGNISWTDKGGSARISSETNVANILHNLPINGAVIYHP